MDVRYTRPNEPVVTRESVAECTDATTLREWYADIEVVAGEVQENINAHRYAGLQSRSAASKLAFLRISQRWITNRIKELAVTTDDESLRIERLRAEVARLHDKCAKQDAKLVALVVHAAGGCVVATERHANALPNLTLRREEDPETGDVTFTTEINDG